jgi:hypothetical protein
LKRVSFLLGALALLSACSTQSDTVAQDCPSDLPQAITVGVTNGNGGPAEQTGGYLNGSHRFLLAAVVPQGAVTVEYGQSGGHLQSVDWSQGQIVSVSGNYMDVGVLDAVSQPVHHRITMCTDSQDAWHPQQ